MRTSSAHGIATTEVISGEQWDRPNGWAPLQWIVTRGLAHYRHHVLADNIAQRWLAIVGGYYERHNRRNGNVGPVAY